jgi:hypothetical protein
MATDFTHFEDFFKSFPYHEGQVYPFVEENLPILEQTFKYKLLEDGITYNSYSISGSVFVLNVTTNEGDITKIELDNTIFPVSGSEGVFITYK